MTADDFYNGTLDEAIFRYKGKVNEWRFLRNGFNLLHCSFVEKPANILKVLPLPFDDEMEDEKDSEYDIISEYNRLKESGALD